MSTGYYIYRWAAKHGNKDIAEMLIYDGKEDCAANVLDEDSGRINLREGEEGGGGGSGAKGTM